MINQKLERLGQNLNGKDWTGVPFLDFEDKLVFSACDIDGILDIEIQIIDDGKYQILCWEQEWELPKVKEVKSETLAIYWIKRFLEPLGPSISTEGL
jgi:hypothetical protein